MLDFKFNPKLNMKSNHPVNIEKTKEQDKKLLFTSPHRNEYLTSDQIRWNEFSQETINSTVEKLNQINRPSAKEIMQFLSDRRQMIAQELNHDPDRQSFFGKLRTEIPINSWNIGEKIDFGEERFDPALNLIKPYLDNKNYFTPEIFNIDGEDWTRSYKYPANQKSDTIFHLIYDKRFGLRVYYPNITLELEEQFFKQLDLYIDKLMNWDPANGVDDFLKKAADLAYDTYRFMPFRLGGAAITNWLIRSIAEAKGIALGCENAKNALSADFIAFFTLEKEKYAEWYCKNAYETVQLKVNVKNNSASESISKIGSVYHSTKEIGQEIKDDAIKEIKQIKS